jgi:hypothetical protein
MPSKKLVWDPQHWRFRAEEARTIADHEGARTIKRRIAMDYDRLGLPKSKSPIRKEERLTIDANTRRPARSELGSLAAVVTGNFLHDHHDPAPDGGIINSHERSDQP